FPRGLFAVVRACDCPARPRACERLGWSASLPSGPVPMGPHGRMAKRGPTAVGGAAPLQRKSPDPALGTAGHTTGSQSRVGAYYLRSGSHLRAYAIRPYAFASALLRLVAEHS